MNNIKENPMQENRKNIVSQEVKKQKTKKLIYSFSWKQAEKNANILVTKSFQVTVSPAYNLAVINYSNRNKRNLQLPNCEGKGQYE